MTTRLNLSIEQKQIVDEQISALCITACAGSGKTKTAIHRVHKLRSLLDEVGEKKRIALLSFSNVAVETFRSGFVDFEPQSSSERGVSIETMDGFLTKYVLRPHAHRAMKSERTSFLVEGDEPFLKNFKIFYAGKPHKTCEMQITWNGTEPIFQIPHGFSKVTVPTKDAILAINRLGETGAYTHELGRYWAYLVLKKQAFVLRALAKRYPHIVVDEAQDIGFMHKIILDLLVEAGSKLTLIGDNNQGIYEFSGADGTYLNRHNMSPKTISRVLTRNFRSVPKIVCVANAISKRSDSCERAVPKVLNGAFFINYDEDKKNDLLSRFGNLLEQSELEYHEAAIVCRSNDGVGKWSRRGRVPGRGVLKKFVRAALERDVMNNYHESYKSVVIGIVALLDAQHRTLAFELLRPSHYPELREMRHMIWGFSRNSILGLPKASLQANGEWHSELVKRTKILLDKMVANFGLVIGGNIGQKLSKRDLPNTALNMLKDDVSVDAQPTIRTCTVHQVKGESIGGVMYIANQNQVKTLIGGTATEEGRIGYVAVTRARNLFVLAIPSKNYEALKDQLLNIGFSEASFT